MAIDRSDFVVLSKNHGNLSLSLCSKPAIPRVLKKVGLDEFHQTKMEALIMDAKQPKTGRNRNKYTTNKGVVDTALRHWEAYDHILEGVLKANLNSHFRDRNSRLLQRIAKAAIALGGDLTPPNLNAFKTLSATKSMARELGLLD